MLSGANLGSSALRLDTLSQLFSTNLPPTKVPAIGGRFSSHNSFKLA
jgi:hypothetical protein